MKTIEMKFEVSDNFEYEGEIEIREMIEKLIKAIVEDRGNYLLCRNGRDEEIVACLFAMRSKERLHDTDLLSDYLDKAKSFLDLM